MELSPGVLLGPGIVMSLSLNPSTEATDYAYISYIGVDPIAPKNRGYIEVSNASGNVIADAHIPITTNAVFVAQFYDATGALCGSICATKELSAVLRGSYYPMNNAFVLLPSLFRPRVQSQTTPSLRYQGRKITSFNFSGDYLTVSGGVVSPVLSSYSIAGQFTPVASIVLYGSTFLSGGSVMRNTLILGGTYRQRADGPSYHLQHVDILPNVSTIVKGTTIVFEGSCIRVVADPSTNSIRLGVSSDV